MFNLNIPQKWRNSLSDENFRAYTNDSGDGPSELLIMEEIGQNMYGDGLSASAVVGWLAAQQDRDINVRINSPGGLVYDGLVIYNALKSHQKNVMVTIEGLAFSAASFIAMAGDTIRMHEASDIGIHRAWGGAIGNAKAMRGVAEWLDTIDGHLVDIYTARTGKATDQINEWLDGTDDGTLFSAKEAVEIGFADELIPVRKKGTKNEKRIAASLAIASRRVQDVAKRNLTARR